MQRKEWSIKTSGRGFTALGLGTWQALYLWEHRTIPHDRHVIVTIW